MYRTVFGKDIFSCTYCLFALDYFFCIFICYVLLGVLLKGKVENSLLSKYELLTPNFDGVMAL